MTEQQSDSWRDQKYLRQEETMCDKESHGRGGQAEVRQNQSWDRSGQKHEENAPQKPRTQSKDRKQNRTCDSMAGGGGVPIVVKIKKEAMKRWS